MFYRYRSVIIRLTCSTRACHNPAVARHAGRLLCGTCIAAFDVSQQNLQELKQHCDTTFHRRHMQPEPEYVTAEEYEPEMAVA